MWNGDPLPREPLAPTPVAEIPQSREPPQPKLMRRCGVQTSFRSAPLCTLAVALLTDFRTLHLYLVLTLISVIACASFIEGNAVNFGHVFELPLYGRTAFTNERCEHF